MIKETWYRIFLGSKVLWTKICMGSALSNVSFMKSLLRHYISYASPLVTSSTKNHRASIGMHQRGFTLKWSFPRLEMPLSTFLVSRLILGSKLWVFWLGCLFDHKVQILGWWVVSLMLFSAILNGTGDRHRIGIPSVTRSNTVCRNPTAVKKFPH